MAWLVPTKGDSFWKIVGPASELVTPMGPWPSGTYIDRAKFTVYAEAAPTITGLRLGVSLGPRAVTTTAEFIRTQQVLRCYINDAWRSYTRIALRAGCQVLTFEVDIGVMVETGPLWVLIFTDLEDGNEAYTVFATVRCRSERVRPVRS
jgi:hypothetical protein